MTLSRLALRLSTVRAITDRTMADDRVRDSLIVELESAISDTPKPVVLVYTDETDFNPSGKELWGGQGTTTLTIILAVAGSTRLESGEVEFVFPFTDETTELSLDIMERQLQMALMDPDNEWAQVWRGLVVNIGRVRSQRGASTKDGARFGARQIVIELDTVHDPIPGAAVEGAWADFLTQIENDPNEDFSGLAAPLRSVMEGDTSIEAWKREMSGMGLDRQAWRAIGLRPLSTEGGSVPLTEVTIMPSGLSTSNTDALPPEDDQ